MKVQWSETNYIAYDYACKNYPIGEPKIEDFTATFEGHVVMTYRSFWGTPKFLVKMDDGSFRSVSCLRCKAVSKYDKRTSKRTLEQAARKDT